MTDSEAAEVLHLSPGAYSLKEIVDAANKAQIRLQNVGRYTSPVAAHEQVLQDLVTLKRARTQLMSSVRGGTVTISASPGTRQRQRSTVTAGRRSSAQSAGTPSPTNASRFILGCVWRLVVVFWLLLSLPFRLLAQKKLVRGLSALILTIGVIWLATFFLTAGLRDVSHRVRRVSEQLNEFISHTIIKNQDRQPPEIVPQTAIEMPSSSLDIWIDDEQALSTPAFEATDLASGTHKVKIKQGEEIRYATRLFFPPGGKVTIDEDPDAEHLRLIIQIDLPPEQKVALTTEDTVLPHRQPRELWACTLPLPVLQAPSDTAPAQETKPGSRHIVVINPVLGLILLPLHACLILMDAAILFIFFRLLTRVTQAKTIAFFDYIGARGVNVLTDAVASRVQRWHSHPWSRRQEEAFTLLLVALCRMLLGVLMTSFF